MILFDFQFNNKKLSDFNCICCNFDGAASGIVEVGAELTLNQERSSASNNFNLYSTTYDNPFTVSFSICLDQCKNDGEICMSVEQARRIQKWLSLRNKKFKLSLDGYTNLYWIGTFTCKQVMLVDAIIGFNLTFTATTPYALQETETFNLEFSTASEVDIAINSDIYGYIDADYTISLKEAGDFKLSSYYYDPDDNKYYLDRTFKVNNCIQDEVITINGFNQLVSSSVIGRQLGKDCNFLLPRLINTFQTDDEEVRNKIVTNLACSIQINYNPVVMIAYGYKS